MHVLNTKAVAALAAGAALLSQAACGLGGSDGDKITVHFASHVGESAIHSLQAQWMMARVVELTDGQVEFKEHYSASLVGGEEVMAGLTDGRVDMAYYAPAYNPAEMPLSQAAGIPFLSVNPVAEAEALRDLYAESEDFHEEFARSGLHVLNFLGTPSSVLGANEAVDGPEDLKGLKVRSVGLQALALEEAGAEIAAIPLNDSIEALERGVLQAYSGTTMDAALSLGLPNVTTHMVAPGTGIPALTVIAVSQSNFESWPEDVQNAFTQAGEELYEQGPAIAVEEGAKACEEIKDNGVEVSAWDKNTVEAWAAEVGDSATDAWMDSVAKSGTDKDRASAFLDELTSTLRAKESESDYVDAILACAGG